MGTKLLLVSLPAARPAGGRSMRLGAETLAHRLRDSAADVLTPMPGVAGAYAIALPGMHVGDFIHTTDGGWWRVTDTVRHVGRVIAAPVDTVICNARWSDTGALVTDEGP